MDTSKVWIPREPMECVLIGHPGRFNIDCECNSDNWYSELC